MKDIPEGYEVVIRAGGEQYLIPKHFVPDVKLKFAVEEKREEMDIYCNKSEVGTNALLLTLLILYWQFWQPHILLNPGLEKLASGLVEGIMDPV